ncbi:MAG: hypothetical protein ACRDBH_03090 [Bosea sp. (in: a-proteobacteria)]
MSNSTAVMVAGKRPDVSHAGAEIGSVMQLMREDLALWFEEQFMRVEGALSAHFQLGGRPPRTLVHTLQDIYGQAGGFGYPLAGRLARSMHRWLDLNGPVRNAVLAAHLDAMRVILRDDMQGEEHAVANALAETLEEAFGAVQAENSA